MKKDISITLLLFTVIGSLSAQAGQRDAMRAARHAYGRAGASVLEQQSFRHDTFSQGGRGFIPEGGGYVASGTGVLNNGTYNVWGDPSLPRYQDNPGGWNYIWMGRELGYQPVPRGGMTDPYGVYGVGPSPAWPTYPSSQGYSPNYRSLPSQGGRRYYRR